MYWYCNTRTKVYITHQTEESLQDLGSYSKSQRQVELYFLSQFIDHATKQLYCKTNNLISNWPRHSAKVSTHVPEELSKIYLGQSRDTTNLHNR